MKSLLGRWFGGANAPPETLQLEAPEYVRSGSSVSFRIREHFQSTYGLPVCNWYVYVGVGGILGALSLPTLVLMRLSRKR